MQKGSCFDYVSSIDKLPFRNEYKIVIFIEPGGDVKFVSRDNLEKTMQFFIELFLTQPLEYPANGWYLYELAVENGGVIDITDIHPRDIWKGYYKEETKENQGG